ncbi:hypothetical protein AVEN_91633-1 [Araneus ventricosus]|uniref:Uncharacterized protein n=1 Tax=Araneus ventricosus TaxID=182803 RepID=A0A4Y2EVI9_ARAVE|nr:hypothetical protein AVEN_91633-1 [Araneus ventricosus]
MHVKSVGVKCSPSCVMRKLEMEYRLGRRPRRLTTVQNYEVRPKIALVLLQKQDLNQTALDLPQGYLNPGIFEDLQMFIIQTEAHKQLADSLLLQNHVAY